MAIDNQLPLFNLKLRQLMSGIAMAYLFYLLRTSGRSCIILLFTSKMAFKYCMILGKTLDSCFLFGVCHSPAECTADRSACVVRTVRMAGIE